VSLVTLDERAAGGEEGPLLALDEDAVLLDGSPSGSLRDPDEAAHLVAQALTKKAELWSQMHPGKSYVAPALNIGIGRLAPWSGVASLVDVAAHAGVTRVWFVFEGTSKLAPPPETDVSRALREAMSGEAVDPSQTSRVAAEHDSPLRHVYAHCAPVTAALAPLAAESVDPAQKNVAFLRAVPDGIEQCACQVDINEVKATQWARYNRYGGTPKVFRKLPIAARGASDATALTAPPDQPWAQAYARVLAASKRGAKVYLAAE
jgi:hypothetical protein